MQASVIRLDTSSSFEGGPDESWNVIHLCKSSVESGIPRRSLPWRGALSRKKKEVSEIDTNPNPNPV